MDKQYTLDEFIKLLTQAKAHLERGERLAAAVDGQQKELARLSAAIQERQTMLDGVSHDYTAKAEALEVDHQHRMEVLDQDAARRVAAIDAAATERTETHRRIVASLQAEIQQRKTDLAAVQTELTQAQTHYARLTAALDKTKAEAKAFSALV